MKKVIYTLFSTALLATGCADLDPTLEQDKSLEGGINSVEDIRSVLNSAYNYMSLREYYGRDVIIFGEVRSDNAYSDANSNRFVSVAKMDMTRTDAYASDTWTRINQTIVSTNVVINADRAKITGDVTTLNHYLGEAYAIRALAHFDLLKLYGQQYQQSDRTKALGVPYTKVFGKAIYPARETVQRTYELIMEDLNAAISNLSASKNDASAHYITTFAAYALKARVALFFEDWATARDAAKYVIDNKGSRLDIAAADDFAKTFTTDNTKNQIFSIANNDSDNTGVNSLGNIYFGSYGDVVMLNDLYSKYEAGDVRKTLFSEIRAGKTYRMRKQTDIIGAQDIPVIRYEEVVLTYAEALFRLGDTTNALAQLNLIPAKRGATAYTSATLENILLERRKEFAGEGFRFYDIARNRQDMPLVDTALQTYGTVTYGSYKYSFPIPDAEMGANSNMKQNQGYSSNP
ncbi:RagB/SusD family nutrient uptake outer membrane protein [Capnocytophaga sputigena]|jgi:ragB/susD domain protein|uniref:RagB/SusD family nutrient uptake outer membrane protein n=1 Tax=Capnocytophaga sputigena TaxID=1019 RepID=UPI000BB1689C|nr:RagB/SusD family nutrient uptake outer membrane protein [Capnocytophaga sputigena]ATA70118.1 RagB/SusD family nutrient uptake outer membrane protein [Capnocytophaga sputigena]PBN46807.1 RagB/SusD family nutrient uptake outer membrane protein [Capnocytophaga sputigena]